MTHQHFLLIASLTLLSACSSPSLRESPTEPLTEIIARESAPNALTVYVLQVEPETLEARLARQPAQVGSAVGAVDEKLVFEARPGWQTRSGITRSGVKYAYRIYYFPNSPLVEIRRSIEYPGGLTAKVNDYDGMASVTMADSGVTMVLEQDVARSKESGRVYWIVAHTRKR